MSKPTVGSLFSGIGGMDLGLERAGFKIAYQVELDPYCQRVLAKHWPDVRRYSDIREVTGEQLGHVDLLCGGPPCQPVSLAGQRRGQADERWLWPEFRRLVRDIGPRFVLVENVPGLLSAGRNGDGYRCVCGWFGRRRRFDLDTERADAPSISSAFYQAGLEGQGYPGLVANDLRRVLRRGEASGKPEARACLPLGDSGRPGKSGVSIDLPVPSDQASTGRHGAALLGCVAVEERDAVPGVFAFEDIDGDSQPNRAAVCPTCDRLMAHRSGSWNGEAFAEVVGDLADLGYSVEWTLLPASAFGAPHLRWRVWLVAYPSSTGRRRGAVSGRERPETASRGQPLADANGHRRGNGTREPECLAGSEGAANASVGREVAHSEGQRCELRSAEIGRPGRLAGSGASRADSIGTRLEIFPRKRGDFIEELATSERSRFWREWWAVERPLRDLVDGLPPELAGRLPGGDASADRRIPRISRGVPERINKLRGLGNAVVPAVAEWIGRRILAAMEHAP